jgi:hypothetical protein
MGPDMLFANVEFGQPPMLEVEIFVLVVWIPILVLILIDLFRGPELSGWVKVAWVLFLIAVPYLSAFCYLIARMAQDYAETKAFSRAEMHNREE